jgi:hypothetical protein
MTSTLATARITVTALKDCRMLLLSLVCYTFWSSSRSTQIRILNVSFVVTARCGIPPSELKSVSDDHPCWEMQAYYIAQLCATLTLLVSPEVIVLGGGVLKRGNVLFPLVRRKTVELLNGYVPIKKVTGSFVD